MDDRHTRSGIFRGPRAGKYDSPDADWQHCSPRDLRSDAKAKVDENLIAEREAGGEALSGQINEAVRAEIERRRRRRLLSEFLDALDAERGPVDEQLVSTAPTR